MTNITIKAVGASVTAKADGKLTSGMVGVPVNIEYDSAWEGLTKTAVFRVGGFTRDRKNIGTATTVPWEVMRYSGKPLQIGIEGRDEDGNIVMPTVWASVSTILPGANASVPGAPKPDSGETPSGGGVVIDDSQISERTTWSSQKISTEIEGAGGGGGTGIDGTTFYPSVSVDGIISWTNDGDKENPEPVNLVEAVMAALPAAEGVAF